MPPEFISLSFSVLLAAATAPDQASQKPSLIASHATGLALAATAPKPCTRVPINHEIWSKAFKLSQFQFPPLSNGDKAVC